MRGELHNTDHADANPHRDESLAAFGLVLEAEPKPEPEPWHLWPEHVPAIRLWCDAQTQWRHGMAGPTGLDYAGLLALCEFQRVRPRRRRGLFGELQVMERAALEEFARQREADH